MKVKKENARVICGNDVKTNNLEEELMKVKKENARVICENDVLQRELTKLRNELSVERCNFIDQINVYIEANGELEQKLKMFDDAKKRNEELEDKMKRLTEENDLLKDKLNQSVIERNTHVKTKLLYVVSCSTNDLNSPLEKYDYVEVVCDKECKKEYENVASNTISFDNKNVGWNIIKKKNYKGKGLRKHE